MESLLTENEVSTCLKVSLACLRRWRLHGEGPQYVKVNNMVRYREAVRKSEDKEQRRSAVLARNKAQAALWEHEQDARDQFSSLHLFIHYWAQGKQENRRAWAQAMNAVVTGGTGSGAVLFQSFPQEVVDAFAEVTGGERVRVRMPKTVNGYAWFDDERRAFLVERIANPEGLECEKRVFLFQYEGKRNLLFENTSAPISLGHS